MVAPEYRYPENDKVPEYLRGKTASEAAQLLQSLVEAAGRSAAQPAYQPPPPPPLTGDDDYVTAAHLKQAQNAALAQVSPWLQTVADQQATMSYNLAKQADQDVFRKYEPEIIQVLQSVPRQQWTLDVIKKAVTMVKGSHVEELANEKLRALEATMGATMRSTGRAGSIPDSTNNDTVQARLEKAPPQWLARAKAVGITENEIWEMCRNNDITPDEFFKEFGAGLVTDAVADVSWGRKPQ